MGEEASGSHEVHESQASACDGSVASTCRGCLTNCSVRVAVGSEGAISVCGNPENLASAGRICPNVKVVLQEQADPDRVRWPLRRRTAAKGRGVDPQFERISWDEALSEIADRLVALRDAGQAHRLLVLKGRSSGITGLLTSAFPKIYGTPNSMGHDGICAEGEKFATGCADGVWDYHDYDYENMKVLLLWGTDPLTSNRQKSHALAEWDALREHCHVVCIDPRRSRTAERSDEWLAIMPGTDGALACALAHVLLVEGLWNRDFVGDFPEGSPYAFVAHQLVDEELFEERETVGLAPWWNKVLKDCTPTWASGITGIAAGDIERIARLLGEAGRQAVSWISTGLGMAARGIYAGMAAYVLNGLLGSVAPDGVVANSPSVPSAALPAAEPFQDDIARTGLVQPTIDQRGTLGLACACKGAFARNQSTNRIADAILDDDPYPVDTLIAYWTNPAFSCTGAGRWERALSKVPFLVYVSTHLAETAQFADIVLPAKHHMLETWGHARCREGLRSALSLEQPVVEAPGEALADEYEFPFLLAEKLAQCGFTALRDYYATVTDPCTGMAPAVPSDLGKNAVKLTTLPLWGGECTSTGELQRRWEAFAKRGVWTSGLAQKPETFSFATPSGRFEFCSAALSQVLSAYAERFGLELGQAIESLGYTCDPDCAALPHYEEPLRLGDPERYPLLFSQHKAFASLEGRSANLPLAQRMKSMDPGDEPWDDVLKVNPSDLQACGLSDGDRAVLVTPYARFEVRVKAWDGTREGVVVKCYGQGHWAYGATAALDFEQHRPRGVNNNEIIEAQFERITGAAARNASPMRIRIEGL